MSHFVPSPFGGSTRAQDGYIVTFELPDGELLSEHFNQLVFTKGKSRHRRSSAATGRVETREKGAAIERAADRADELGAKIVCVSSPQSILTDLQGARAPVEARPRDERPSDQTVYPEAQLLGRIGRLDLFKPPTGGKTDQNIRQIRQRRSSTVGPREQ